MTYTIGYMVLMLGVGMMLGAAIAIWGISAALEMKKSRRHSQCRTGSSKRYYNNNSTSEED